MFPLIDFPDYLDNLCSVFRPVFKRKKAFLHFKRSMLSFAFPGKDSLAHNNSLFVEHPNQSSFYRFISDSPWDIDDVLKLHIQQINEVESDGSVIIDDYIVEKSGKTIFGTDTHWDHSQNCHVFGHQIADCVFSGKGIYPLLFTIYLRECSHWLNQVSGDDDNEDGREFKSKIQIQMEHLDKLVELGLEFSRVLMDSWYFSKEMAEHIEQLGKDWISRLKSNRKVKYKDKYINITSFAKIMLANHNFRVVKLGKDNETYQMKAFTVHLHNHGPVRLLISLDKNGNLKFYVTNRLDWDEVTIARYYLQRWDIEVWHRRGKQVYALKQCQLRGEDEISKYLILSFVAGNLLQIATMISPSYADIAKLGCIPEMEQRWLIYELMNKMFSKAKMFKDDMVHKMQKALVTPYKSTMRWPKSRDGPKNKCKGGIPT